MADGIRATPYRSSFAGSANDILGGLLGYMRDPRRTQQMQGLAGLLESTGIPKTVERLAYGEPLTNLQKANVPTLRPETAEALMTLLPVPSGASRAARAVDPVVQKYGPRLEQSLLPAFEAAYNRGGLTREMVEAMGTNTVSQMFIGPSSPLFNKDMALKASQMEKKGAKPQEIWQATGTVRAPDGQLRQEISDKASRYDPGSLEDLRALDDFDYLKQTQPLGGTLEHSELYKAYPDLSDVPVHFMPSERMKGAFGAYSPKNDRITLSDQLTPEKARSSALHEIQHAIQEREGFAVGGNTRDFAKLAFEANQQIDTLNNQMRDVVKLMDNPSISKQDKAELSSQYDDLMSQRMALVQQAQIDPMEAYGNLMGEAEARLTQRRMDLGPRQRRENFPFEYTGKTGYGLDVPPEGLIQMDADGTIIRSGLLGSSPTSVQRSSAESLLDYRGSHTAPGPDFGAPLHDLTGGGQMYPADVYSPKAAQYYGTGYAKADKEAFDLARRVKGNPDAEVTMYRAVPNSKDISEINVGDWVTLSQDYAKNHGDSVFQGDYKILKKKVKAKDLWTNADSIHEFGYHPQ